MLPDFMINYLMVTFAWKVLLARVNLIFKLFILSVQRVLAVWPQLLSLGGIKHLVGYFLIRVVEPYHSRTRSKRMVG